ncbi:hypothetical protein LPB86_12645 [Pedobacter sp. MC2016-14]|uniref:hypothetical protein n=1 Tax=Pedobacter sp. MC2016-14 TaxID=2897327 RepID=UPI001E34FC8D|nr:hypothetical protein [Pedobacter sp. MC2016-14]MCD0489081.1 hypothetical protein [Pedobacter sp. MC2016-14]
METLTIQIPDKEATVLKEILKKFNVKIINATNRTPNALTVKTIHNAHNGIELNEPIKNIRSFIDSI